jgi:hypothetical protein
MADYYTPTVIQQSISDADMTPLELLLLAHIFDAERDSDGWYFFSEQGPSDMLSIERGALEAALAASESAGDSTANRFVREHLPDLRSGEPPRCAGFSTSIMWAFRQAPSTSAAARSGAIRSGSPTTATARP